MTPLHEMGRRFHAAVNPPWKFNAMGFTATMEEIKRIGFVSQTDGGFIAGTIQANPIAMRWVIAKEFLWWAEDGSGMELRRRFREWAIKRGADEIQWSCPPDARARKVLARRAQETEIVYSEFTHVL